MPEIGLLPFARAALQVARAALPTYGSRFSKHPFPQPQLLVILCRMRYEDISKLIRRGCDRSNDDKRGGGPLFERAIAESEL